jgi:flagellar motility protein MotE (MotC chaperone)
MSRAIKVLTIALVLFSASAAASWYLQQRTARPDEHSKHGSDSVDKSGHAAAPGSHGADAKPVRPALRTPLLPEAENLAKMVSGVQQQMELVRQREQQLAARQKHLDVIYQDLRSEQKSLEDVRKQIAEEMKLLGDRLDSLDRKTADAREQGHNTAQQAREMKQTLLEIDDTEKARVKQMASVYDSMDPEGAAQTFQEMVESGKLDMAAKILASMRERQAARVLSQLPNHSVAVQLLERLKGLKASTGKDTAN